MATVNVAESSERESDIYILGAGKAQAGKRQVANVIPRYKNTLYNNN